MPEAYYLIPMSSPPYSRENPQRPLYVDEIRCNWTGHNVDEFGYYVCKVNTTEGKHADLAGRQGVFQLPRGYNWDTPISSLPAPARNVISNWCTNHNIAYDENETIGEFLMRVINSGLWNIRNISTDTQFQNLTAEQKSRITNFCTKWGIPTPSPTESLKSLSARCGRIWWYAPGLYVPEG